MLDSALNYLSSVGMNAFSFLTMNINGDDKNVFPFISDRGGDRMRIDISKTAQWEVAFSHADAVGLFLHFKTQEQENDQLLDGGNLGPQRTLYYRELIARFGHHLALNWNLGEENTNTAAQRRDFARYFKTTDPYQHPVVMHTFVRRKDRDYGPLLGNTDFDGPSLQSGPLNVFNDTLFWREASAAAGHPWICTNDEQGPASTGVAPDNIDPTHDRIRRQVLYGNLMAGGGGVEYYFGFSQSILEGNDLTTENFRSRQNMWDQSRFALEFFRSYLPFWSMSNDNNRVSYGLCLASTNVIAVYLDFGDRAGTIDLSDRTTPHRVQWYNPRTGGNLLNGSVTTIQPLANQAYGTPPIPGADDWLILLTQML